MYFPLILDYILSKSRFFVYHEVYHEKLLTTIKNCPYKLVQINLLLVNESYLKFALHAVPNNENCLGFHLNLGARHVEICFFVCVLKEFLGNIYGIHWWRKHVENSFGNNWGSIKRIGKEILRKFWKKIDMKLWKEIYRKLRKEIFSKLSKEINRKLCKEIENEGNI